MYEGERPRKPSRVIVLVIVFWVVGISLQTVFDLIFTSIEALDIRYAGILAQILAWGLLFAVSYKYREPIDVWLRRR
jgi:hypothetical protein